MSEDIYETDLMRAVLGLPRRHRRWGFTLTKGGSELFTLEADRDARVEELGADAVAKTWLLIIEAAK